MPDTPGHAEVPQRKQLPRDEGASLSEGGRGHRLVLIDHPAPHVARITLNRPERLNAMSIDLVIELWDAL
ncbi:MAG TPA: hypothetical protein PKY13_07720, partial [Microthrixaceae bacterium]|nr:hypothetical protein [Microthrixaceae bacterium]